MPHIARHTNKAGLPKHYSYGRPAAFFDWHPRRKWAIIVAIQTAGGFIPRLLADPAGRSRRSKNLCLKKTNELHNFHVHSPEAPMETAFENYLTDYWQMKSWNEMTLWLAKHQQYAQPDAWQRTFSRSNNAHEPTSVGKILPFMSNFLRSVCSFAWHLSAFCENTSSVAVPPNRDCHEPKPDH